MTLEYINPEEIDAPQTYSHVVVATGPRMVFVAGQVAEDGDGNIVGPGDMALVGVAALSRPKYLLEVDAVAVVDDAA